MYCVHMILPFLFTPRGVTRKKKIVKLPTHPPEDIFNGNRKQLRGGKRDATRQQTTKCIYMITHTEIGFTNRPRNIQNFENTILTPDLKILYFGLSITLFISNIRAQTKVSNRTTTISIRSITILIL